MSYVQAAATRIVSGKQVLHAPPTTLQSSNGSGKQEVCLDASQLFKHYPILDGRMCCNTEFHAEKDDLKPKHGCWTKKASEGIDNEEIFQCNCKRSRTDMEASPLVLASLFGKQQHGGKCDIDGKPNGSKLLKHYPSSPAGEVDLELRLGKVPKIIKTGLVPTVLD